MDVEKIIRILGYIVYTALWSPIIVTAIVAAPIVLLALDTRVGRPIGGSIEALKNMFMESFYHDMNFIRTGKW
jgi:hypothetical protein